jgi:hypothetical protein
MNYIVIISRISCTKTCRIYCRHTRDISSQGHVIPGIYHPRGTSSLRHIIPGTHHPRDTSSQEHIIPGTHHPRDMSSQGHVIPGIHHPRDTSAQEHIIPGTHHPRDTSSQGHASYKRHIVQWAHCMRKRFYKDALYVKGTHSTRALRETVPFRAITTSTAGFVFNIQLSFLT